MEKNFDNHDRLFIHHLLKEINSPLHIHDHDDIEIMIILNGTAIGKINDSTYTLSDYDVIVISGYQPHSYSHSNDVEALSFIFRKKAFEQYHQFFTENSFVIPILNIKSNKYGIIDNINTLLDDLDHNLNNPYVFDSYTIIIIEKLIKIAYKTNIQKNLFNEKKPFLKKAQEYCIANYAKNICIEEIAKNINVHPNYLSTAFKQNLGTSITNYINIIKVKHACDFIRKQKYSMATISEKCGFNTVRNFNRVFLKEMGCTPKEYQKQISTPPRKN